MTYSDDSMEYLVNSLSKKNDDEAKKFIKRNYREAVTTHKHSEDNPEPTSQFNKKEGDRINDKMDDPDGETEFYVFDIKKESSFEELIKNGHFGDVRIMASGSRGNLIGETRDEKCASIFTAHSGSKIGWSPYPTDDKTWKYYKEKAEDRGNGSRFTFKVSNKELWEDDERS